MNEGYQNPYLAACQPQPFDLVLGIFSIAYGTEMSELTLSNVVAFSMNPDGTGSAHTADGRKHPLFAPTEGIVCNRVWIGNELFYANPACVEGKKNPHYMALLSKRADEDEWLQTLDPKVFALIEEFEALVALEK